MAAEICFDPVPLDNIRLACRAELVNHFIFKHTAALLYHFGGSDICFVAAHKNLFIAKVFSLVKYKPQHLGGIALSALRGSDAVTDLTVIFQ